MRYDVTLTDPLTGATLEVPTRHLIAGGIYALGGATELWLNVTYNYAVRFRELFGKAGIRTLYGMTGAQSQLIIEAAMKACNKNTPAADYWEPTDGNVYRALAGLLVFAELRPDGIWAGD